MLQPESKNDKLECNNRYNSFAVQFGAQKAEYLHLKSLHSDYKKALQFCSVYSKLTDRQRQTDSIFCVTNFKITQHQKHKTTSDCY